MVDSSGTATVMQDPTKGPYDGSDDTLVGVVNNSGSPVKALAVSSPNPVFAFDGDGICSPTYHASPSCPFGNTGYEGPGVGFGLISPDFTNGVVAFSPSGIASNGGTAYFGLESALTGANQITGAQQTPTITPLNSLGGGDPSTVAKQCSKGGPVNCATGDFWHTFHDLSVPGRGPALDLSRTYNSLDAANDGPFGFGWASTYSMSLTTDASGNVTVHQENGAQETFNPFSNNVYFAPSWVLATLVKNVDGTFTYTRRARQIFNFSAAGQLTSLKDLNGYTTTVLHDVNGHITTVTDPAARSLAFSYGANGRVAQVTDPANRKVTYTYDTAGNLTQVNDVANQPTRFGYDGSHHVQTMQAPRGGMYTNIYDASGRVTSQRDPVNASPTTFVYTSSGTTITDPKGIVEVQNYTNGLLVSKTTGYGTSQAVTWNYTTDRATAGMTSVTNAADPSHPTTYTYDPAGNLTSIRDALGRTASASYDALDDMTSATDGNNVRTTLLYDGAGNLLSRSTPLVGTAQNQVFAYGYGDATHPGDVTSVTDPDGKVWHDSYNLNGYLNIATDPLGDATRYCYDGVGRPTQTITPIGSNRGITCGLLNQNYSYLYDTDAFGAVTATKDPLFANSDPTHHRTVTHYDADHNRDSFTDANNNVTTYAFDLADRLTTVTRPDHTTLSYGYDADGNRTSSTDGATHITSYHFDDAGLPKAKTSETDPDNRTTTYTYDRKGNRLTKQDNGGNCGATPKVSCTTFGYDVANELTAVTYSDGTTPNVTGITYDGDGQRTAMTDGTGTSHWIWDSLHRMTSSTNGSGKAVGYGYNLRGGETSITYPNGVGTVNRTYDDAGRLSGVTDWLSQATSFGYDRDSNLTTESYPNGTTGSVTVDPTDSITSVSHAPTTTPSAPFASFTYGRDGANQVGSVASTGVPADNHTYSYTPLEQLSGVDAARYGYDGADNLTTLVDSTPQAFDAANQLTAAAPPITLVGSDQGGDTGLSSKTTLKLPAGHAANDQVIVATNIPGNKASPTVSGYTLVGTFATGATANDTKTVVFRRTALAGDTSAVINYGSLFSKSAVLVDYRGVDPATPIDVSTSATALAANAVTVPSLLTTADDRLLTLTADSNASASGATWVAPAGMTPVVANNLSGRATAVADQTLGAPGPTGTRTANLTSGVTASLVGVSLALRHAAVTPGPTSTTFGYDTRGNRTSVTPPGGAATNLSYDQANRLTAYGTTATYAYDGDGVRQSKTVSGTREAFVWDESGDLPLALMDGTTAYIYGPGGVPLEQITTAPPAISLVGSAQGGDGGAASKLTLTLPTGLAANDQIVVSSTTGGNKTTPTVAGFSTVGTYATGTTSTDAKSVVFRRTAAAGDTQVILDYGTSFPKTVVLGVYRGVDPTTAIDAIASGTALAANAVTVPSITTSKANERLLLFTGDNNTSVNGKTWVPPAGMTTVVANNLSPRASALADQTLTSAGATGSRTSNLTGGTASLVGVMLSLSQAPFVPAVLYYHQDQAGSTRALTNANSSVVATYTYDAYGRAQASTGSIANPFGYGGQFTDAESGLVYLRARYYDPTTAQFLSRDPVAPPTPAPYEYSDGDPLNANDVLGLSTCKKPHGILDVAGSVFDCISKGDVGGAAETTASGGLRTASTAIANSPGGMLLGVASRATGVTIGGCVSADAVAGIDVTDSLCYYATPSGQDGLAFSYGAGPGAPIGVSLMGGISTSNAQCLSDLNGWFQYWSIGGGAGIVGGAQDEIGHNKAGRQIGVGTVGVGYGGYAPAPVTVAAGGSYTWTFPSF